MAKKIACSPFQSLSNCCLEKLEFIQQRDFTPTTDIFIVLDNSGSFSAQRQGYIDQINNWYTSFRENNKDYLGTVYFYPASYDTVAKQSMFYTVPYLPPKIGGVSDTVFKSLSRYRKVTASGTPTTITYSIAITFSGNQRYYFFDNSVVSTNSWDTVFEGLIADMNADSIFANSCSARIVNGELLLHVSGRPIYTPVSNFTVSSEINPPLLTSLYADGIDYSYYSLAPNFVSDENWLNYPKKLLGESQRFIDAGLKVPEEVLFIYLGDEASVGGAYYHGPNIKIDNVDGYGRTLVDLGNYGAYGYTRESLNAASGIITESTAPEINAIQSTVLSDPYKTVNLPTWGNTVVGGGYKEHYDEFVNTYYHKFKFFRGIIYGLSNSNNPADYESVSTRNVYHSFIYQAIEPSTVKEDDFIESSYAKDQLGNPTGLTLAFIKTRNYLAEAGYAGLKNYGWKEYHDVGYGTNVASYFTSEIFNANIEKALLNGSKYKLQGTLSNGIIIESNEFTAGTVQTTPDDVDAGFLVDKIVAGDNINIVVEDAKLVISSTATGGSIEKDLTVTVDIPNAGYSKGDTIGTGTSMTDVIETLLCPYTPPSFSSFSVTTSPSGTLEVGVVATVASASFTSVLDSAGDPPSNISILGAGFDSGIIVTGSPVTANGNPTTVTRTTAGSEGWSINGEDADGLPISRSTSKAWQYMHRSGASASNITDSGSANTVINSLTNNTLTSGKVRTITCTSENNDVTKYTYISYDASYGDLSNIIQNGSLPVLTAFIKLSDYSYTNQYGATRTMRTYKSNSTGAFASGTVLTLS